MSARVIHHARKAYPAYVATLTVQALVATAVVAVLLTGASRPAEAGSVAAAGQTQLASVDQASLGVAGDQASLSATGRYLAFTQESAVSQVIVRDLQARRSLALNLPAGQTTQPQLSADGDRLAFLRAAAGTTQPNLYVDEGLLGGHPHPVAVGGAPGNPQYQQDGSCESCRPALSADGKAVVMPATLSTVPSQVALTVNGSDLGRQADLMDFGQVLPGQTVTLHLRAAATGLNWAAPSLVAGGSGAFSIGTVTVSSCGGQRCQDIPVTFHPSSCMSSYSRRLRLSGVTAPNLGEVTLVGDTGSAASCTPRFNGCDQAVSNTAAPELTAITDNGTAELFDAGAVPVGQSREVSGRIVNDTALPAVVHIDSSDCGQAVTVLPGSSSSADQPCRDGMTLQAHDTCLAQVRFTPQPAANPYVAGYEVSVLLDVAGRSVFGSRFTAHSTMDALVELHAAADGSFGRPAVVSLDQNGRPLDAEQPSVSGDGRYVAFSSPGGDNGDTGSLYVRDSTASSTRLLPYARPDGFGTRVDLAPSLSSDGNRIAFTSMAGSSWDNSQVFVRDLSSDQLMNVSASQNGVAPDAAAYTPALSADGSAVAFATDDVSMGAECGCAKVYARAIPDDLGDSTPTLLESTFTGAGTANDPVISADGGETAFTWTGQGTASSSPGQADGAAQVYTRIDPSNVELPDSVDLGASIGRQSSPVAMELTNAGPAPVRPGAATVTGPFTVVTDTCTGTTLHAGDSCSISVGLSSAARPGRLTGRLTTGWTTAYLPSRSGSTELTALLVSASGDRGVTRPVSVGGTGPGLNSDSLDPAVSADGRFTAFLSSGRPGQPSESYQTEAVFRRDQAAGSTVQLSGDDSTAGPPAISGDGQQIAYIDSTSGVTEVDSVRLDSGTPSVQQVSGSAASPKFERVAGCGSYYYYDTQPPDQCRPVLSSDGRSLVYPATLDASPVAVDAISGPAPTAGGTLLDFGDESTSNLGEAAWIEIPLDHAGDPMNASIAALGSTAFLVRSQATVNCAQRSGRCLKLAISFDPPGCNGNYSGLLTVQGARPASQSMMFLAGYNDCSGGGSPTPSPSPTLAAPIAPGGSAQPNPAAHPAAAGCAAPPPVTGYPSGYTDGQLAQAGSVELHQPIYLELDVQAQQTRADSTAGRTVDFTSPDCAVQLIAPPMAADSDEACHQGQHLDWNESCEAFVEIAPTSVRPYAASLELNAADGSGGPQIYRVVSSAIENVLVMVRDSMGSGSYLQAGQPAPEVISRTSAGALMDGSQPSVSADGRYVAFSSLDPVGRPAGSTGTPQVYLRDTQTGTTRLVSYLPGGAARLPADGADQPALSGDGNRIAFSTGRDVSEEGSDSAAVRPAEQTGVGQVYVRDLAAGRSLLVSARQGMSALDPRATGADGPSLQPALSADGSTVAFTSTATDLVAGATTGDDNVFLRYLATDLSSAGDTELMSVDDQNAVTDSDNEHPAVSSDGTFTTFDSTGRLTAADQNYWSDIYSRQRLAAVTVQPVSVDFGPQGSGTVSGTPTTVRISNAGPGPISLGDAVAGAGFGIASDECAELQRDQSCALNLVFAPMAPGPVTGLVTVPSAAGYLTGPSYAITLTGQGIDQPPPFHPSLSLSLPVSRPGRVVQLTGAGFPPDQPVRLAWQPGLGDLTVTSDAEGDVTAELPIFAADATGPRVATGQVAGLPIVSSPPLLVEPGTVQPPDFAGRG